MTSLTRPTRPTAAEIVRDPAALDRWMEAIWDYDCLAALEEVREERDLQAAAAAYDAVVRRPDTTSPSADLSAKQLRQAISLGVQMAERDALLKLAMKAKQVTELDRRRPRLVVDNTK